MEHNTIERGGNKYRAESELGGCTGCDMAPPYCASSKCEATSAKTTPM